MFGLLESISAELLDVKQRLIVLEKSVLINNTSGIVLQNEELIVNK